MRLCGVGVISGELLQINTWLGSLRKTQACHLGCGGGKGYCGRRGTSSAPSTFVFPATYIRRTCCTAHGFHPCFCPSCQKACHHKTMTYDEQQIRHPPGDVLLLIDTYFARVAAHKRVYICGHARPCPGIGKHVTARCIYQRD